ncbi:MAG: glycosyltransferase family 1 protein, partial [Proteobacteria bacterium]|nr:glycosyltransferase family 1 protein [Pseudomonadota bacterium]
YRIENGVDLKLCSHNRNSDSNSSLKKIVYAGAINDRLDTDLLISFAENNNITLDLYGNTHQVLDPLTRHRNISYKGLVSYFDLPKIFSRYEYGLLPYRNLTSIQNSSPLKVLQYFASGLQVLSFPFTVWADLKPYIGNILGSGAFSTSDKRVPTKHFLQEYSWSKRIDD